MHDGSCEDQRLRTLAARALVRSDCAATGPGDVREPDQATASLTEISRIPRVGLSETLSLSRTALCLPVFLPLPVMSK